MRYKKNYDYDENDYYEDSYDLYDKYYSKSYKRDFYRNDSYKNDFYKDDYDYGANNDDYYYDDNDETDEELIEQYYTYDDQYKNEEYDNLYENQYNSQYDDQYKDDTENELYENETNLNDKVDDDLAGYFSDARLFNTASKKKPEDEKKKKPKRIIYKANDKIVFNVNKATVSGIILFGPYDVNKKQMYQIELEDGSLAEADEKHIRYANDENKTEN